MDQVNLFLDTYGLAAIFIVLLVKSIGIPIPVPSDAIILVTAARASEGRLVLWQAFAAVLVALVVGGIGQFLLVRGAGRTILHRFGGYIGLTPARLEAASAKVQKSGPVGIGLAILTPGVRSIAIMGCGLAGLPSGMFVSGLILGSTAFLSLHFFLGYIGRALLMAFGLSLPAALGIVVVLLAIGLLTWLVIRRRRDPGVSSAMVQAEAFEAWHEATCPVCLALGALSHFESHSALHQP